MTHEQIADALEEIGLRTRNIEALCSQDSAVQVKITCVVGGVANRGNKFSPKRILKSGNRTIVFWQDGTKTIVKRSEDEAESDYAAFTAALGIKLFGSNSALKRIVARTETQKLKKGGIDNGKTESAAG